MNLLLRFLAQLPKSLSRITSGKNFIPEIDGLRFIAIFPVVMLHLLGTFIVVTKKMEGSGAVDWAIASEGSWLVHLISNGHIGVPIFFVISGFILAVPFARKHFGLGTGPKLKPYFLRRLSRLEPTYIINLCVIMFVFVYVWNISAGPMVKDFFATLFYVNNQVFAAVSRISDVTWSLEVEIQFYILAPLLTTVFAISNKYVRRLLLIVGVVVGSVMSPYNNPRIDLSLVNYIQYFLSGFLLADLFLSEWKEKPSKTLHGDIIGVCGGALLLLFIFEIIHFKPVLPLSIMLIFVGAFKGKVFNYIFTRKPLVVIGGMCYTIYLYHNLIIYLILPKLISKFPNLSGGSDVLSGFFVITLIMLPMLLVVCSILFALFERPFMRKEWYKITTYEFFKLREKCKVFVEK